jgi:hypothetical protein
MLWCPIYTWKFFFGKETKISIFGGISEFLELIVFGQILAVLADFAALAMADSMPEPHLKSYKLDNF